MFIVAIDPAPAKPSTICTPGDHSGTVKFETVPGHGMGKYVERLAGHPDCLVCWDAPLTGPREPRNSQATGNSYSQRGIESFFSQGRYGFKAPKGISVRPYSGCPHWAITRATLGLPIVGPWDLPEDQLPLEPIFSRDFPRETTGRARVVEVHPAVAIWLWCRDHWDGSWEYKIRSRNSPSGQVFRALCEILEEVSTLFGGPLANDDELDALVGYTLASRWVEGDGSVILLGSREEGGFLVPNVEGIEEAFADFV